MRSGAFSYEDFELIPRSHEKPLGPLPLASSQVARHPVFIGLIEHLGLTAKS